MRCRPSRTFPLFLLPGLLAQQPAAPIVVPPPIAATAHVRLGDTGLEMVLPPGFTVGDAKPLGTAFVATGVESQGFRENLNFVLGPDQAPTVDDAALKTEMVGTLGKQLLDYEYVADGRLDVRGKSAWWISGRFTSGAARVRNLQVLVPGEPCFWFTFTGADAAFEERQPVIQAALASLRTAGEFVAPPEVQVRQDGKRVAVDQYGFSFEPPAGWRAGPGEAAMGAFLFLLGEPVDGFAPNVNVRTAPPAERMDPRAVRQALVESLPKLVQAPAILECAVQPVGKLKPVRARVVYERGGSKMTLLQYYVPGKPHSFVVTFTVPGKVADTLLPVLDASAATMQVVAPAKKK